MSQFKKGDHVIFTGSGAYGWKNDGIAQSSEYYESTTEDMRVLVIYEECEGVVKTKLDCLRLLTPLEHLL